MSNPPPSIVSHVGVNVQDFDKARAFYGELLKVIDAEESMHIPGVYCSWGCFSFGIQPSKTGKPSNTHIAFNGKSREQIAAFHEKALALGATCNGKPGLRPEITEGYYAAFVHDLEGNNIEIVMFEKSCPDAASEK
ncbi:Glyoxalase/Bleomycin resistance protein/Dihydroxybiphenyl dioxygenase [Gongronella butleri]|nr:Glyoxalase/Bleomycin resistance protein/Dihydroxybiphenyl dioxygenase [Gongronella butleri]